MTIYTTREMGNNRRVSNTMSRDALTHAQKVLLKLHLDNVYPDDRLLDTLVWLNDILDQEGCEHFEGDGTLTHLIDIVIRG